jgi:N-methylhydantoinase B
MNVKTTDNRTGRTIMASIDPITGGAGGWSGGDGADGSGANSSFLKNTPVEINEAEVPVKILRYGLKQDSGGAGHHRGGTGTTLEFQVSSPDTVVTARNRDRTHFTPWGSRGGDAGKPSEFLLNPGTNHEVNLGNTDVVTVQPGDVIRITSAGAGGWGNALEREPERVLEDVRRGFVSIAKAKEDYGVVIIDGAVDTHATRALRASLTAERRRNGNGFGFNPARVDFERMWTRANYDRLTALLAKLPVEWRFFVKHRVFESIERLPERERTGTGGEVDRAFQGVIASYAQLKAVASARQA